MMLKDKSAKHSPLHAGIAGALLEIACFATMRFIGNFANRFALSGACETCPEWVQYAILSAYRLSYFFFLPFRLILTHLIPTDGDLDGALFALFYWVVFLSAFILYSLIGFIIGVAIVIARLQLLHKSSTTPPT